MELRYTKKQFYLLVRTALVSAISGLQVCTLSRTKSKYNLKTKSLKNTEMKINITFDDITELCKSHWPSMKFIRVLNSTNSVQRPKLIFSEYHSEQVSIMVWKNPTDRNQLHISDWEPTWGLLTFNVFNENNKKREGGRKRKKKLFTRKLILRKV